MMQKSHLSILLILLLAVTASPQAIPSWRLLLSDYARQEKWEKEKLPAPTITAEALDEAIDAAALYIMNQQYPEGNFRYAFDFTTNIEDEKDNQVRQAGVTWAIANICRDRFTEPLRRCSLLSLDFFIHNQRGLPDSTQIAATYKADSVIKTGTVALFCMALVDFLDGQDKYITEAQKEPFLVALQNNLKFLKFQELPNGSWREEYALNAPRLPEEFAPFSPYFDGETLLAYLFAAKYYRNHPEYPTPIALEERVLDALPKLLAKYTVECFVPGGDTNFTKGFYQWGCMSCALAAELFPNDETTKQLCLEGALALTWWQLLEHRLLDREGNTGYAVEGLVSAYVLAKNAGKDADAQVIRGAIDAVLAKLMTWQIGGPFHQFNPFFKQWAGKIPDRAFGGITSAQDSGYIRIDVVQHQLHAMLLARKYLYTE